MLRSNIRTLTCLIAAILLHAAPTSSQIIPIRTVPVASEINSCSPLIRPGRLASADLERTWQEADGQDMLDSGGALRAGDRTIENEFFASVWMHQLSVRIPVR